MFPEDAKESHRLYQRALPVMPGGNTRHTVFFQPHPVYIERGEGCRVWDVDGVERIDCINNYSSLIHGHCHPAIVEALREQAGKLLSVSLPTEAEIRLAGMVTERLPGVDQVRFANSGTEAVMLTVMAARAYTGRNKIAKIEGAYHGSYDAVSVSMYPTPDVWGADDAPASVPLAGVSEGACQDVIILRANDVEGSRAILRRHAADLAGVLVDPMAKNLGFLELTQPFLKMLREEVDSAGALLMYDEVYSFRMSYNGAQGAVGVLPDLTALGKVIGGGMPVGAIGGKRHIMEELFDPRGPKKMGHGGTFNANPMTMAAGAAALEHYDQAAHDRLAAMGEQLRSGLREIFARQGRPATVTGAASMIGLFHTDAPMTDWRASLKAMMENPALMQQADTLFRGLLNEGVYMASQGFFVLSTAMTPADIDFVLDKTEQVMRQLPAEAA